MNVYYFSSKLHIPANIGTAAAPGEVPTGKFVSANSVFQHGSCLVNLSFLGSGCICLWKIVSHGI